MTKEIVFLCVTDSDTGFGHLSRCITLASGLRKKGYKTIFLINQKLKTIEELKSKNFVFEKIPKFSSKNYPKYDPIHVFKKMKSKGWETIIVDMRNYGENISKFLKNKKFNVILLDDAWCKKPNADLIINGTITKKYHKYSTNSHSKIFKGTKFWISNPEFSKYKKKISEVNHKKKYCIVVSMGGSDQHELTSIVIESLANLPNVLVTVIIGPFFKKSLKLKNQIKNSNVLLLDSPKKIWKEFHKCDLVICSPGNTLYELCIQQIPTISIAAEPHQLEYANDFSKKGFSKNLGLWKNMNSDLVRKSTISLLNKPKKRKEMCIAAKKIIDGKGLHRVIKVIDTFLKNSQKVN